MKLVFNLNEVAEALGHTPDEFRSLRPKLEQIGFPKPVRGLEDRWAIMDVIRWVNNEKVENLEGFAETSPEIKSGSKRTKQ